jgi:hypothetical protein
MPTLCDGVPTQLDSTVTIDAAPNRKRGRSMSRRFGQSGYVVKKGKQWHGPDEREGRRRVSVPLGAVKEMTKTQAKLKLRQLLEEQVSIPQSI